MGSFPISPKDQRVDQLGSESRIRSEADAEAYIDALLENFPQVEHLVPSLSRMKKRLGRAEYAAVRDTSKAVPEAVVAEAFNRIMDRWGTPLWARVSPDEVHVFRVLFSPMRYPHAVSRLPSGQVAKHCRPVEALYLIYLLDSSPRALVGIRQMLEANRWPGEEAFMAQRKSAHYLLGPMTAPSVEFEREREYVEARARYFQEHADLNVDSEIEDLFAALNIS